MTSTDVVRQPSPLSNTTTYLYSNTGGWLSSQISQTGVTTGYAYNNVGETTTDTDGANNHTTYGYDLLGRRVSTVAPDGSSQTVTYDQAGRPVGTAVLDGGHTTIATTAATSAVTVSLFDTMTELMGCSLTYTQHSGIDQEPVGMGSPAVAPYGAYRTADGQTVVLGTTNDREWQRLARDVLRRPDLADDERFRTNPGRVAHRAVLDAEIGAWCAGESLAHAQDIADAAGIGNSRINRPSEVVAHPHLLARDRWRRIDTPAGPVPVLLPPPVISGYEPPMGAVPGLGQHTDAVLAGIGMSALEIAALREQGAIGPAY